MVESTSSLPDPTAALSKGLSQQMIFSSNQLPYKGTIMQCFDFYDENGYIYYTQSVGDTKTGNRWMVALGRQKRNEAPSDDYMKLQWFGHGTLLVAERADDGDYVWELQRHAFGNGLHQQPHLLAHPLPEGRGAEPLRRRHVLYERVC